jgi:hypothetical protein
MRIPMKRDENVWEQVPTWRPWFGIALEQVLARITDSMYRLAMDIGLGKFLEMFEDRFGRKATTGLLFMIGLGVLAVVIPPIYEHLIIIIGKIHSPEVITLNWTDVSQVVLTTLQVMLAILWIIIILAFFVVGPLLLVTMVHLVIREFVYDYWNKYFLERKKEREKASLPQSNASKK